MFTGFFYYLRAGGFSVGPVEWMTPVSYTHLDVYKRQVSGGETAAQVFRLFSGR